MLNKLGGIYATRPSAGPHRRRESIPLSILLRNRLHYAFTRQEAMKIVKDKEGLIKVDNKIRRDPRFPLGIMDVVSIEKTGEFFRILYDTKGRYQAHKIDAKEGAFKLCSVKRKAMGENKIPYIVTHDGRTIRYPHPDIKKQDTIKVSTCSLSLSLFLLCTMNNFILNIPSVIYS
jgi:small subunit ribosomal protein S4e